MKTNRYLVRLVYVLAFVDDYVESRQLIFYLYIKKM